MKENIIYNSKAGLAPGTLVYDGDKEPEKTLIKNYRITNTSIVIEDVKNGKFAEVDTNSLLWVRVAGLADVSLIGSLGKYYGIDHLILEDILETNQRPKCEKLSDYVFIIIKQIPNINEDMEEGINQLSILFGNNFVITFEECLSDRIPSLEKRIFAHPEGFFLRGASYLAYTLIDISVDEYIDILDCIETDLEDFEDEILESNDSGNLASLFRLRRRINILYRNTRPLYEIVEKLMKPAPDGSILIGSNILPYLRDLADQAIRLSDSIQGCKESIKAIYEENISRIQLQTNNIINILTGVSVLLLPSMVISGIFGMNFEKIPGLSFKYGFIVAVVIMAVLSFGLFYIFKRKKIL